MDYGFSVPARGPLANRDGVDAMAKHGEKHGFAYLAVPDHIVAVSYTHLTLPTKA